MIYKVIYRSAQRREAGEILLGVIAMQSLLRPVPMVLPFQPRWFIRKWRKAAETVVEKRNIILFKNLSSLTNLIARSSGLQAVSMLCLSDLKEQELVQEYFWEKAIQLIQHTSVKLLGNLWHAYAFNALGAIWMPWMRKMVATGTSSSH